MLVCGLKRAPCAALFAVLRAVHLWPVHFWPAAGEIDALQDLIVNSAHASKLALVQRRFNGSHWGSLLELSIDFMGDTTSDPRDRIYCLLGLAESYSCASLVVDYTEMWQNIFKFAARCIIEGSRKLDILTFGASGDIDLPSWVPRFARRGIYSAEEPELKRLPCMVMLDTYASAFRAGGDVQPNYYFTISRTGDSQR